MSVNGSRASGFALGSLAAALLLVLLWLAAVSGLEGREHPNNRWIEEAHAHKRAAAARMTGPRVLVVSGSSAMFAVDSKILAQALGRPVANLAANAGVLTPYILSEARQVLRPGDWVILPLEYPLFHDEGVVNEAFLNYYVSHPLPIAQLGARRWLKAMWLLPLHRLLQGFRGMPAGFTVQGTYGAHNLDEHGDQLNSSRAKRTPAMLADLSSDTPKAYGRRSHEGNASWTRWRKFADEVRSQGGCAVFVPPAMLRRDAYVRDPLERQFYTSLPANARSHGLNYVGTPFDFMYEDDDFFDTIFHLTSETRTRYSQQLAAALRRQVSWDDCSQKRAAAAHSPSLGREARPAG